MREQGAGRARRSWVDRIALAFPALPALGMRRGTRVAATVVCLGALMPAGAARAQAPVRVMSFNIRYGTASDGAHAWPLRRTAVIGTIADHAPHVLAVQEALRFQLDEVGTALGRYQEVGVGRDDGLTRGEYTAILVDTARFTVVAQGTFWLSDTPDVPGSMHWGNRITRITTWARLADRATDDTLRVYNAHWDHESQPSRERSAALLLARIARDASPSDAVLVLGDFNSGPTNPAFLALVDPRGSRLKDVHALSHPERRWPGTFNGFRGDTAGEKIDAILVSPEWEVRAAGIDMRRWGERWASDHFAVWAIVDLRAR